MRLIFSALILAATLQTPPPANTVTADATSVAAGKKLYASNCASCHGETGQGDGRAGKTLTPPPANLADETWLHGSTDGEIFVVIRDGVIQDADARTPDVGAGAVAFDERDDRIVRHDELSLAARDGCAHKVFLGQVTCRSRKISANAVENSVENVARLHPCDVRSECFSGLHHVRAIQATTKTLGLYLQGDWRVD